MELIRDTPTERLTFDDGNWVELKARLTIAERKKLQTAAMRLGPKDEDDDQAKPRLSYQLEQVEMAGLYLGIVAWSLPDPVTPENIALLDEETGQAIKVRLDELWRTRTDDERKNSSGGGAPPVEEKAESPKSSGG